MRRTVWILVASMTLLALFGSAPAFAFNRDAAVSHAEAHWNDTSTTQPGGYYPGTDCTNYVSNSAYAGSLGMDAVGGSGWWRDKKFNGRTYYWDWSLKWVNADAFRLYFKAKTGVSDVGAYSWGYPGLPTPPNDSPMIRGDFVSVNWDKRADDVTDHLEFGVGYGTSLPQGDGKPTYTGDLIDQHSSQRHQAIWHMRDRKTLADMTHHVFRIYHFADAFTN